MEATVTAANQEAVEAWDGVLFDRFSQFRHLILPNNSEHSDRALALHPPQPGERVLDVGCGFGDVTQQIAAMVGPEGEAVGVDASPRFIEAARAEAAEAGMGNVRFEIADIEAGGFGDGYDRVFSRFGTMFFGNPVRALRNVRESLVPGGQLCMVVWRQKTENPWMYEAQVAVERYLERRENPDEPTCGPGPFSMANADTTTGILVSAGYEDIRLDRTDTNILVGSDMDEAIDLVTGLGPAGEIIRLAGQEAEEIRPKLIQAVREALEKYTDGDGVRAQMSTWAVSARTPTA